MKTEIFKNYEEFLKRKDKKVNGVSKKFAHENLNYKEDNESNLGCWNCYKCRECSYCCDCRDCSYNAEKKEALKVPKIENIHQKIYKAASKPDALDMSDWHTCKTTHCRAGWVVHLSGQEGKELENKLGTPLAAAKIYNESSDIKIHWALQFFEDNDIALNDMKRCANLEKEMESN